MRWPIYRPATAAGDARKGSTCPRAFALVLALHVAASCFAAPAQDRLRTVHIHHLSGTDPTLPYTDIAPLIGPMSRDAQFFAIGESVHGVRAFLELEHRLTQYLIEQQHYRLILTEEAVLRTESINEWLATCAGGGELGAFPVGAVRLAYAETVSFYKSLCAFNRQHPNDPVRIAGMDVADRPWELQDGIASLTTALLPGPRGATLVQTTHDSCALHAAQDWSELEQVRQNRASRPVTEFNSCIDALNELSRLVLDRLKRVDSEQHQAFRLLRLVQTALGWQQFSRFIYYGVGDRAQALNARDDAMALNVLATWREYGRPKTIILAHTTHTTLSRRPVSWFNLSSGAFHSCLYNLRRTQGVGDVRAIALIGYDLTGLSGKTPKATSPDSLNLYLHDLNVELAFLDAHGRLSSRRAHWWIKIDNAPHQPDGFNVPPSSQFDAYIFVNSSAEGSRLSSFTDPWMW